MPTAPPLQLSDKERGMMDTYRELLLHLYNGDETMTNAHVVTACRTRTADRTPETPAVAAYRQCVEEMFGRRPELVDKLQEEHPYEMWGLTVAEGAEKKIIQRYIFVLKQNLLEIPRSMRLPHATKCDDPDSEWSAGPDAAAAAGAPKTAAVAA